MRLSRSSPSWTSCFATCHSFSHTWTTISSPAAPWKSICCIFSSFFQVLQENGLTINAAKCVFAVPSLKFLGHMVDEAGITPLPRHIAAVQDCPLPTDIKQLQPFLGLINFYRRFLPAVARTLQPLTDFLKGSPKVLLWSPAADAAFVAAKARPGCRSSALPSSSRRCALSVWTLPTHT